MTGVSCMLRQKPEYGVVTQVWLAEMREMNNILFLFLREGDERNQRQIRCDIFRTQNRKHWCWEKPYFHGRMKNKFDFLSFAVGD